MSTTSDRTSLRTKPALVVYSILIFLLVFEGIDGLVEGNLLKTAIYLTGLTSLVLNAMGERQNKPVLKTTAAALAVLFVAGAILLIAQSITNHF